MTATPRNRRRRGRANKAPLFVPALGLRPFLWRAVQRVLQGAVVVSLLWGVVVAAKHGVAALSHSDRMRVRQVEVSGLSRASRHEVLAYLGVQVGDPILDLDLDSMALRLRRHPWVKSAMVRRSLPSKLLVAVVEHEPAVLVGLSAVYVADAEGKMFKRLSPGDDLRLPVVLGLDRELARQDPGLTASVIREAAALSAQVEKMAPVLGRLEEIGWDSDLGFSMLTARHGSKTLRSHLGMTPRQRLPMVLRALRQVSHRPVQVIWADGIKHPERVEVRFHDETAWVSPQPTVNLNRA